MLRDKKLRINRIDILICLVFVLIFVSNDTYLFGTNANSFMLEIPRVLLGIFIVLEIILLVSKKKLNMNFLAIGIIMAGMLIGISMYHGDPVKLIIIKCLCIFSALLLTLHYDFNEYAEAFTKVMVFNAVTALLLEVIVYLLPSVAYALPRMLNTASVEITTIGFAGIDSRNLDAIFIRNSGIFWEPGVFQMYLNLAIIFELFRQKGIRWKYVFILMAGVFITFSTTCFIVLIWIFVSYALLVKKEKVTGKTLLALTMLLVVLSISFFAIDYAQLLEIVFGKLSNSDSGSMIARSASVFVNLDIFFDHPFVGVGMSAINTEMVYRSALMYGRPTTHNTNTLLYQFAAHGLFYGGLFFMGTCKFTKCLSNKIVIRVSLVIALILIYVGENLRYSILPFILIFYGFNCKKEQIKK